ncbi:MAG: TAXI family TRAP transporter solute-binding subunit [Tissierellia bacterium]|nr:TAXI family TRAP transporter solute-binding subunit [Tissierellia bacterium]MDD4678768.1 TAXI family TRAP transporter solute-binding subunit [Tissierellia bacterium]
MKKLLSLIVVCILVLSLAACSGQETPPPANTEEPAKEGTEEPAVEAPKTPQDLVMGTGSSGGTYFALGGAMSNAMNKMMEEQLITVTAQASGASVENINLINAGEMDLGMAMNNVAANAFAGTGAFNAPVSNVSSIGVVYNEVYQIVANAKTGAKNVEDLKGLTVAVGPAGSGTVGLTEKVLAAAGLDIDKDIKRQSDSFGDAATKMQDGHIDAACNVLAVPASSIIEMSTVMDLAYVDISDEILATIQADEPYFVRKVIPAGTYKDQAEDNNTITCKAAMYCRADLDEETVYQITKAMYETGDVVAAAHATGKEIQLEGALEGITTPIHPGAARYYQEMGIEVPDNK